MLDISAECQWSCFIFCTHENEITGFKIFRANTVTIMITIKLIMGIRFACTQFCMPGILMHAAVRQAGIVLMFASVIITVILINIHAFMHVCIHQYITCVHVFIMHDRQRRTLYACAF